MKKLLKHNFISHYGLNANVNVDVISTTVTDFDLKDDTVLLYSCLSSINPNGYKTSNPDIEFYGFELWEFSGKQIYVLK